MLARVTLQEDGGRPQYGGGRDALIAAAVRVVGARGLRGLTYRAVAQEAGVTHGLVAHHFGSRDALLHETLLASAARSAEISHLESGTGELTDLAAALGRAVADDDAPFRFELELLLDGGRKPEIGAAMREVYDSYVAAARRELRRAGLDEDDDALARLVFAALDGLVLQQLLYGDRAATDRAVARLHRLLADAQRAPADAAGDAAAGA